MIQHDNKCELSKGKLGCRCSERKGSEARAEQARIERYQTALARQEEETRSLQRSLATLHDTLNAVRADLEIARRNAKDSGRGFMERGAEIERLRAEVREFHAVESANRNRALEIERLNGQLRGMEKLRESDLAEIERLNKTIKRLENDLAVWRNTVAGLQRRIDELHYENDNLRKDHSLGLTPKAIDAKPILAELLAWTVARVEGTEKNMFLSTVKLSGEDLIRFTAIRRTYSEVVQRIQTEINKLA